MSTHTRRFTLSSVVTIAGIMVLQGCSVAVDAAEQDEDVSNVQQAVKVSIEPGRDVKSLSTTLAAKPRPGAAAAELPKASAGAEVKDATLGVTPKTVNVDVKDATDAGDIDEKDAPPWGSSKATPPDAQASTPKVTVLEPQRKTCLLS